MTALGVFLTLVLVAGPAVAQQSGTITGAVTNSATMETVNGAQISIEGTGIGTITGSGGRYLLPNVPAGEVTVVVQMIGHSRETGTVQVTAGETVILDFEISQQAVALNELVVTGTAGATEKRTLGNSIATIDAAAIVGRAPVTSVDELVMGRNAGVRMGLSGGGGFFGGQIRIRGSTSVNLSGDPIIYIDGVRVDGSADDDGVSIGGQQMSRIMDLQPADIDRIEIVKGAAAASLYGTQGSNGVIQIFTKRGRSGEPQWNFTIAQGLERVPTDTFPGRMFTQFVGPSGFRARDPLETVENGYHGRYTASVSGGTQDTKYYLSGSYRQAEGSIAPNTNWMKQFTGRANVSTLLADNLTVTATTSFTNSRFRVPDNDNALHGTYSQFASAVPYTATPDRPFGERFGSFEANQTVENHQRVLRNTTGITVEHAISDNLSQRLTTGIDWYTDEFTKYFPFAYEGSGNKLGNKLNMTRTFRDVTLDYRLLLSNPIFETVTSNFSVGVQGDFMNTVRVEAEGEDFPAPGVRSVNATSTTSGSEQRIEEINAGIFVEETIGLFDKLFLTGGVRVDGNSSFGNEFTTQAYPKAAIAYNISEESFWPTELVPTLKLRAAYGESGLAPAQFEADRTYESVSAQGGQPAVTPGNIGNPNLGPETSREVEMGFDAGFWDDRIGLEVTSYFQRTTDALLEVPFPPSEGFQEAQLTNVGEIENRGIEVGVNGLWIMNQDLEWSTSTQFATMHNEVTDLGGLAPFNISGARIVEGYPVSGQWGYEIVDWNPETRSHTASDTMVYYGQSVPKWYGSFSSSLRYRAVTLSGLLGFSGGQVKENFEKYWSIYVRTGDDYLSLLEDEIGTPTPAADSLRNWTTTAGAEAFTGPAGFTALRELAINVDLPDSWLSRFGLSRSSVRLSGRNLFIWSEYSGISPETSRRGGGPLGVNSSFDTQPVSRVFMVSFRTSM